MLAGVYGSMVQATPEPGCSVTLLVDLANLPGPAGARVCCGDAPTYVVFPLLPLACWGFSGL